MRAYRGLDHPVGRYLSLERVDRLTRLYEAGYSAEAAARAEGVARKTAQRYRRWWREKRRRDPGRFSLLRLPEDVWQALSVEALARCTRPDQLGAEIIAKVLGEGLTDVILW